MAELRNRMDKGIPRKKALAPASKRGGGYLRGGAVVVLREGRSKGKGGKVKLSSLGRKPRMLGGRKKKPQQEKS